MEAIAAVGLASNVLDFVNTIGKLCILVKQYSSAAGAPDEVVNISDRLALTLTTIHALDETTKVKLDHEKLALKICCDDAERLRIFLESLKIQPRSNSTEPGAKFSFLKKLQPVEKGWKVFKALGGDKKLEKFQVSLNRVLDLVMLQQQSRIEVTTLRTEEKVVAAAKNSELILEGLRELQLGSASSLFASAMQPKTTLCVFMVPLGRNLRFLGRDEIMTMLDMSIGFRRVPGQRQVQRAALCGLGGIGKSQIALEYGYRTKQKVPESSVFWVYAGTAARFEESYKRIAAEFELPGRDDPLIDVLQLVRNFFEGQYNVPWLMIIDNIDDSQIFCNTRTGKSHLEYIPQVANGSILYTSRNRDVAVDLVGDPVSVPSMSVEEARMLLGERVRGISTEAEQDMLLMELDNLPLAIVQAVSYMNKRRKSIPQYLKLLQDGETSKLKLLAHGFSDVGREATSFNSVTMTWIVSFQQIDSENPRAANLLFLMSVLDRQSIPVSLLVEDNENPVDFEDAIGILEAFSFVSADDTGTTYSMHRLVQAATRAWLSDQEECTSKTITSQAMHKLSSRYPNGDFETWTTCARYLPHAEVVLSRFGDQSKGDNLARANLLRNIARYLGKQCNYPTAKLKAMESLEIYRAMGGPYCAEALQVSAEYATIVGNTGDLDGATKLYRETLKGQESLLGKDHQDTLETVDSLAWVLIDLGVHHDDHKEAELLAQRALTGREKVLPTDHPKVLNSILGLGWSLYRQGKFTEAEILFRKCKTKREIVLGELHPDTSLATNSLALALSRTSKYEESERCFRHSVKVTNMLCGVENHQAIVSTGNLGLFLADSGKLNEAETLQRKQLELSERILGRDHPTTIWFVGNLADVLGQQKKYEDAESMLREQLLLRQQLSEKSPEIIPDIGKLTIMFDLADVLHDLKRNEESLVLFNKVLAGWQQLTGENHPEFFRTLSRLSYVYECIKDFNESEKHKRNEMTLRQSVRGYDDISTLQSAHSLARILLEQGTQDKNKEAEEILRKVVAKREILLGKSHENTLLSAGALGDALFYQKKYKEAEIWFRRVLTAKEEVLGNSHEFTLDARDDVERTLFRQEKWEEVAESYRRSLYLRRKVGPERYDTIRIAGNLATALHRNGKDEGMELRHEITLKAQACYSTYMEQGNYEEAILAKESEMYNKYCLYGWTDPKTMKVQRELALAYEEVGRNNDAEEAFKDLLVNMRAKWGSYDQQILDLREEFAQVLDKHGKTKEAADQRTYRPRRPRSIS